MKKWGLIAASAAAISLLLSAAPIYAAEQPANDETQNAQSPSVKMDPTVQLRLTEVLYKLAGKQAIEFTSVDSSHEDWEVNGILGGKTKGEFIQRYNSAKGRVESTIIIYKQNDLDNVMDAALRGKMSSFIKTFGGSQPFQSDRFWRVYSPYQDNIPRNYWVFWGIDQSLYIDLDHNNNISASVAYPLKKVPAQLNNTANRSIKTLGISIIKPFNNVQRQKDGDKEFVWKYQDNDDVNHVIIGVQTGKVWEVENLSGMDWANDQDFAKTFAKPKLSKAQAISTAKPKVKSLFGINLDGYSVQIKQNEYTFSKKGALSIAGKINKQGKFYSLQLIPANGVRN